MPKPVAIAWPLLLALVLAVGFALVWAALVNWGVDMAWNVFGPERTSEYLELRMDGTPVVRSYRGNYGENSTYRGPDGKRLSISSQEAWLHGAYLFAAKDQTQLYSLPALPWEPVAGWKERLLGWQDGAEPANYWYFLLDPKMPGTAYFLGFDSFSKRPVGYIGRNGFQSQVPSADERFAVHNHNRVRSATQSFQYSMEGREPHFVYIRSGVPDEFPGWMVHVLTDKALMEVDLLKRSVQTVLNEPGLISADSVELALPSPTTRDSRLYRTQLKEYLAIRSADRVLVHEASGRPPSSFVIPAEFRHATFSFFLLSDKSAVLAVVDPLDPESDTGWRQRLVWIDSQGNISRREELRLNLRWFMDRSRYSPWRSAFDAPAPLAVAAISTMLEPWILVNQHKQPTYLAALATSCVKFWPALVVVCLFGGLMAWLCYRRQDRYGLPWTKTWVGFVFLCGLPGLVAYRVHRRWPVLTPCSHCGWPVPCDRDACFACGREFPTPAPKGIEVFA